MENFDASFVEILDLLPNIVWVEPTTPRFCRFCGAPLCRYNLNDFCLPHTDRNRDEQGQEVVDEEIEAFMESLRKTCEAQEAEELRQYLLMHELIPTEEMVVRQMRTTAESNSFMSEVVMKAVCIHFELEAERLIEKNRSHPVVHPRQVLMYLLRHDAELSFPEIGKRIGNRDHTTVMYGVEQITVLMEQPSDCSVDIAKIRRRYPELLRKVF